MEIVRSGKSNGLNLRAVLLKSLFDALILYFGKYLHFQGFLIATDTGS